MNEQTSDMMHHGNGQPTHHDDNQANSGTARAGRLEVRFLVCSRDAGAIIGKKGSNIQNLRQKHKVIIQVPDCDVRGVAIVSYRRNSPLCVSRLGTRTCLEHSR